MLGALFSSILKVEIGLRLIGILIVKTAGY